MARDIEEFLRRAAERRQQQGGAAPARPTPPARPAEPLIIEDVQVVPPSPPRKKKRKPVDLRRQSVDEHVQQHLDTSSIAEHAESLGSDIARSANRSRQRVQQHLDHDLSKIDDRPTITDDALQAEQGPSLAARLKSSLRSPQSVGQAILLAEILKRPELD